VRFVKDHRAYGALAGVGLDLASETHGCIWRWMFWLEILIFAKEPRIASHRGYARRRSRGFRHVGSLPSGATEVRNVASGRPDDWKISSGDESWTYWDNQLRGMWAHSRDEAVRQCLLPDKVNHASCLSAGTVPTVCLRKNVSIFRGRVWHCELV
jgi:hypothetical protein